MADNSNPFPILPQYQGDYLDAQRKMAIAQMLQQQAFTPPDQSGWNQMRVVPKQSSLGILSKIGEAMMAKQATGNAIDAQRQLGQEQWQGMQSMFSPQTTTSYQDNVDQNGNPVNVMQGGGMPTPMRVTHPAAMNPGNMDPRMATMAYMRDPSGYLKEFVAPYYTPTDATKMAMQSGQDPGAANAAALAKANNVAPAEGRAGGYTYMWNPKTGQYDQPRFNQPIPEGGMPIYDQSGKQIPGVAPLPGAAGLKQTQAYAGAIGEAGARPIIGYDANNQPIFTNAAAAATGQGGQGGSMFPGVTGLGSQQGPLRAGPTPGAQELYSGFTKRYQEGQEAARTAPADIQALRQINQLSTQAKTGVGFDRKATIEGWASILPGVTADMKDSEIRDEIGKWQAQIAGRVGGRSDAALENALHGTPNFTMTPQAIQNITPSLIGLRSADLGRSNAATAWLQSHGNAPSSLPEFEQKWNAAYNPDVYRFKAMNPAQRQAFQNSMSKDQAVRFMKSAQALQDLGAMPDMGQ